MKIIHSPFILKRQLNQTVFCVSAIECVCTAILVSSVDLIIHSGGEGKPFRHLTSSSSSTSSSTSSSSNQMKSELKSKTKTTV